MAQHFWLMQRAITLQDKMLTTAPLDHKTFSLYLRYQTTNEGAHYKAKRELATQRKEQAKQQNGFESQNTSRRPTKRKSASPTPAQKKPKSKMKSNR